jgi:hypothetical protein
MCGCLAVTAGTGTAVAVAPDRFGEVQEVHESVGTCGSPADEIVADFTVRQDVTVFSSGRATLHLSLVGTMTRTGTGLVGKYAERQRDIQLSDGSFTAVGLLSHLVAPGGGALTVAGRIRLGPDGTLVSVTPGLNHLFELEERFVPIVCDALSG